MTIYTCDYTIENISDIFSDGSYLFEIQADDNWKGSRGTTLDSSLGIINKVNIESNKRERLNDFIKVLF